MALNTIAINKRDGGLKRELPGLDHYSGLMFYVANGTALPAGFSSDASQLITSLKDAESKGIESSGDYAVLHYQIKEFFRITPGAVLYVGIAEAPSTGDIDYEELKDLQTKADGNLRQIAVHNTVETFATEQLDALQTVSDELEASHQPAVFLFAGDISGTSDLETLPDLRSLEDNKVSVVIAQDGGNEGAELYDTEGVSIPALGAALGAVAGANVHESIAWVKKFNMAANELDVPALAEGSLISELAESALTSLDDKGYIFLRKFIGLAGSYFNDNYTATAATSDYAYINTNRVIDKAVRGVRTLLLPELNSPLRVNDDGTLATDVVKYFEAKAARSLEQMERDGELSAQDVYVDPDQDVVSTSELKVEINLVPVGVARKITVSIGFVTEIS